MEMQELKSNVSRSVLSGRRVVSEMDGPMSSGLIEFEPTTIAIRFVLDRARADIEVANPRRKNDWFTVSTVMNLLQRENDFKDHDFAGQLEYLNLSLHEIETAAEIDSDAFFKKLSEIRLRRYNSRIKADDFEK